MRIVLVALGLTAALAGCKHTSAPPGEGLAEIAWTFEPGPGDEGIPPARATLRYDGTGTLDTGTGPRAFTLGPIAMTALVEATEKARAFAGERYGDPACAKSHGCTHHKVEIRATRGAAWTLEQFGTTAPPEVAELFFSLLHGVRPK
ncbi:hypothetical protein [Vulgatibacter incomptus]|uniref:Lipoprotein n=1 Tax=Vulgatibacter incomptus TaxID=1391653 RepID=A0A0K1PHS7_9BACT|nr:hypothetical protein [Vulgatibacter incomptus]AKU93093.1 hypothetical protein AKJ08_3480 [Vulgatibacter incomptus]